MDDHNGKKAACWKKTQRVTPSFQDILSKLEELRGVIEEERDSLQVQLSDAHADVAEDENKELGVGSVNDG